MTKNKRGLKQKIEMISSELEDMIVNIDRVKQQLQHMTYENVESSMGDETIEPTPEADKQAFEHYVIIEATKDEFTDLFIRMAKPIVLYKNKIDECGVEVTYALGLKEFEESTVLYQVDITSNVDCIEFSNMLLNLSKDDNDFFKEYKEVD